MLQPRFAAYSRMARPCRGSVSILTAHRGVQPLNLFSRSLGLRSMSGSQTNRLRGIARVDASKPGWLGYLPLESKGYEHEVTFLTGKKKDSFGVDATGSPGDLLAQTVADGNPPGSLGYAQELWTTRLLAKHIRKHCVEGDTRSCKRWDEGRCPRSCRAHKIR